MSETNTRQAKRAPVTLKIKFKSETLDQFIERYSVDISAGGIFIRTKNPLAVGTILRFEFQLKDASPLITGDGAVVWTRDHDPTRVGVAPGMGVRFDRLSPESKQILDRIMSQKSAQNAPKKGSFEQGDSTKVAPDSVIADLAQSSTPPSASIDDDGDSTPLPKPVPFHTDADEYSDQAFSETTRVTDLDELAASTSDKAATAVADDDKVRAPAANTRDYALAKTTRMPAVKAHVPARTTRMPVVKKHGSTNTITGSSVFPTMTMHGHAPGQQQSSSEADDIAAARAEKERKKREAHARKVKAVIEAAQDPRKQAVKQRLLNKQMALAGEMGDELGDLDEDDSPSSSTGGLMWVVAGVALLLVAGIGSYVFLFKSGESAGTGSDIIRPDDDRASETEGQDEPRYPGIGEGFASAIVDSSPQGADVELVGKGAVGTVPMTFQGLAPDQTYTARVSLPGYQPREVLITARDGETPKQVVELAPAPRKMILKTVPPGATIIINSKELEQKTPAEFMLEDELAGQDDLEVVLNKAGHVGVKVPVNVGENFQLRDGVWVLEREDELEPLVAGTEPEAPAVSDAVANQPEPSDQTGTAATKDPEKDQEPAPERKAPAPKDPELVPSFMD